jgi:hypothetical protein
VHARRHKPLTDKSKKDRINQPTHINSPIRPTMRYLMVGPSLGQKGMERQRLTWDQQAFRIGRAREVLKHERS